MKQITLYLNGIPVIHKPISHPPFYIGTNHNNDLIIASPKLRDCRVAIEQDAQGKWISNWHNSDELPKTVALHLGKRMKLGEFEIELSHPSTTAGQTPESNMDMVGYSPAMQRLRYQIRQVGPLNASVLVEGESGTGKELTARALHKFSNRNAGPLVAVNCGAITDTMAEDIFFGHEKGAFTGAQCSHKGAFEQAHNGTLFLDEIGELPLSHQASLLRVLDNGCVSRIGSEQSRQVNFRLITATNQDLKQMVEDRQFRLDLYHRIATLRLTTPPLRYRTTDIRLLAERFLHEISSDVGKKQLDANAVEKLRNHSWPGNCRELKNALYKAAALCSSTTIHPHDLELSKTSQRHPEKLTNENIINELTKLNGNVSATAKALGIPRTTLRHRLKQITPLPQSPAM